MSTCTFTRHLRTAACMLLAALWLAGCEATGGRQVAVAVSAINYTEEDLNGFLFINPETNAPAGGPGLHPYEAGGTMCCYELPQRWRPGIRVKLRYDWWNGSSLKRDYQFLEVELPRYEGEPTMLWALFYPDGEVEVLASAVDPGHPQWAGRERGWPVPSQAYRLKMWERDMEELRIGEQGLIRQLGPRTDKDYEESWAIDIRY
ncbi:DUF3304 domain-containing protein, partial [Pseudothauera lacus]